MKKENRNKGNYGEEIAIEHLLSKDYKILEKNFITKIGEIDIVAMDKDIVVFIEVKLRRNLKYGYPFEAVDYRKQRKIINVAKLYVKYKKLHNIQCRFDIIEVYSDDNYINHISNAFWA